jgi:hypothetical protein
MVEHGTLLVRTSAAGVIEYVYPGRRPIAASVVTNVVTNAGSVAIATATSIGPPPISLGDSFFLTARPKPNPVTAVMLSMLIPGAGHIYSGRPGAGVAWMATTLMGYACCFLPGLFLHGLCLVSAAQTRQG